MLPMLSIKKNYVMNTIATIKCFCPNCGGNATRVYFNSPDPRYHRCASDQVIQTECPSCDYLMVMCARNGIVIEAYAPSTLAPVSNLKLLEGSSGDNKRTVFC